MQYYKTSLLHAVLISVQLENIGYTAIEDATTDEQLIDKINDNELEYTEDGKLW